MEVFASNSRSDVSAFAGLGQIQASFITFVEKRKNDSAGERSKSFAKILSFLSIIKLEESCIQTSMCRNPLFNFYSTRAGFRDLSTAVFSWLLGCERVQGYSSQWVSARTLVITSSLPSMRPLFMISGRPLRAYFPHILLRIYRF